MPTIITAQNGKQIRKTTKIQVMGCRVMKAPTRAQKLARRSRNATRTRARKDEPSVPERPDVIRTSRHTRNPGQKASKTNRRGQEMRNHHEHAPAHPYRSDSALAAVTALLPPAAVGANRRRSLPQRSGTPRIQHRLRDQRTVRPATTRMSRLRDGQSRREGGHAGFPDWAAQCSSNSARRRHDHLQRLWQRDARCRDRG